MSTARPSPVTPAHCSDVVDTKVVMPHAVPPTSGTVLYAVSCATEFSTKLIPDTVRTCNSPATSQSGGPFGELIDVTTGASKVNTPCAVAKYHPRRWTMIGCRTPARAGNRLGGGIAHLHRPNQRSMQQRAVIQIRPSRPLDDGEAKLAPKSCCGSPEGCLSADYAREARNRCRQ